MKLKYRSLTFIFFALTGKTLTIEFAWAMQDALNGQA